MKKRSKRTFTLIETIVAAVIIAVICTVLTSVLVGALNVYRITPQNNAKIAVLKVQEIIAHDLKNTGRITNFDVKFSGSAHKAKWYTFVKEYDFKAKSFYVCPAVVEYAIKRGDLYRKIKTNKGALSKTIKAKEEVLLHDVDKMNFYYAYYNKDTKILKWSKSWKAGEGNKQIPVMVGIDIYMEENNDNKQNLYRRVLIPEGAREYI